MKTHRLVVIATAVAAATAISASALGSGGPAPGAAPNQSVFAPSGTIRYAAIAGGARTSVTAIRVRDGRIVRHRQLVGRFGVPVVANDGTTAGVSRDGRTLALASYGTAGATRFAVLGAHTFALRRIISLPGRWTFDAISPSARTMYLIQYVPGGRPLYHVRVYDLAAGRLLPRPVTDPHDPKGPMRGYPVSRATSPNGRWAYTLSRGGREGSFVHALDTARRAAVCVDLNREGTKLALRGNRLVVQGPGGPVATIDTRTMRLVS